MCLIPPLLLFLAPAFPLLLYFLMTCRPWACVLAHLGCVINTMTVVCEHRCLFLTVLEAEVQDQGTAHLVFSASCLPGSWASPCPHMAEGQMDFLGFCTRHWTPLMRLCPHYHLTSQRPGLQIAITSYQVFSI